MAQSSDLNAIREAVKKWEAENKADQLPKAYTSSGIEVKPVYTPLDVQGIDYLSDIGLPGEYPLTRGIHPFMYRTRVWTMRQYSGYASTKETNKHFKFLLEQGATGMSVAHHLPTQLGYDSDTPDFEGDVGGTGVAIDSLQDMEIIFDGIPLDKISTSFTINATTSIVLAMYIVAAEKRGIPPAALSGTVQNDTLKEFIARGAYIFPVQPSLKLIGDVVEYCAKNVPRFSTTSVSGYHIRETGGNAIQEMAYSFAIAIAYIEHLLARGLDIDSFAHRISWNMAAHMDFFEDIAKFRAGRKIWAKLLRERYGSKNPRCWKFQIFAGNGGSTLTGKQPDNNIIRGTLGSLALVLSGCQAMTTNTKDEGLAIPTPKAQEIALRTQQIIAYESNVGATVDPLAGSYFIESLTKTYEEKIWETIDEIERLGGMVKAIEDGFIQRQLLAGDYARVKGIQTGERPFIGVNKYVTDEAPPKDTYKRDWAAVREQIESVKRLKTTRPPEPVRAALAEVKRAAENNDNLMPPIIEAVRVYATVGEIVSALKEVYGAFKEPAIF
ncbi:MAG: methylmalonyl-CoA mutase family protein [Chloroflexi bacterium]|nr:methylmalonyl-CoA mutase family protein [Chloroflexota bacterium]